MLKRPDDRIGRAERAAGRAQIGAELREGSGWYGRIPPSGIHARFSSQSCLVLSRSVYLDKEIRAEFKSDKTRQNETGKRDTLPEGGGTGLPHLVCGNAHVRRY